MNIPIINPSFSLPRDGWFHLVPTGEYAHAETGVVQVLDDTALQAMLDRFNHEAQAPGFSGLLVDYDHFSYDPGHSSEAAGWIIALKLETGPTPAPGLWARIRWTPEGEAALKAGRYRFISPVWLKRDCEEAIAPATSQTNPANSQRRVRPLRLDSAGLTNNPNLKGMAPLSNREPGVSSFKCEVSSGPGVPESTDAAVLIQNANAPVINLPNFPSPSIINHQPSSSMKQLNPLLGLSPEAPEDQTTQAVQRLLNRAAEAETRAQRLETENQSLRAGQAEADLDRHQNRFAPESRDKWRAALVANRDMTLELLESLLPLPATAATGSANTPLHQRANAKTPGHTPYANRSAEQRQAVLAYKTQHRCTWQQAWDAMRAQQPELFGK